jgi:hypothetical protein
MNIAYTAQTPPTYEAPEFTPQEHQPLRFVGEEPLVFAMGEVNTGLHTISLKVQQGVEEAGGGESTQRVDASNAESGYDSDSTQLQWKREQKQLLAEAEQVVKKSGSFDRRVAEQSLRSSEVGKRLTEDMVVEVLRNLRVAAARPPSTEDAVQQVAVQQVQALPPAAARIARELRSSTIRKRASVCVCACVCCTIDGQL